ncbi:MAG: serine/threonine protein kinase [Planctomycetes bacterium]|nr:serine/threonine protein kinase [Planctomycetota bacterium]
MPDRPELVQSLFLAACKVTGAARLRLLDDGCGGDAALRAEVEQLLQLDAETPFLREDDLLELRGPLAGPALLPAQIAGYRILDVLGSGGMGVVYRAEQQNPPRQVALKVLAPGLGGPAAQARFALEAEALGRLQHPGIAAILQAGSYASPLGEQPFLAMELVDGEPLPDWVARTQPTVRGRLELLIEVCTAVQHAHEKGLIHRDLKPGNVLVDRAGRAKVLDFGIARFVDDDRSRTLQTMTGQVLGTLAYMSPEQANGQHERIDVRTDVYALGVLGYELLTGALPIDVTGAPWTTAVRRLCDAEPKRLGEHDRRWRGDLETIFAMALRKEPERRYGSAQALADDLRRFLAHEPIQARPATTLYVVRRFARRHRGLVAGGVLATLALLGGTAASLAWAMRADAAERHAKAEARLANRTVDFVRGLFAAAAPRVALGQTITARDLVAEGSRNIGRDLADEPVLRASLEGLLGTVLSELGDHTTAEPMLADALAVRRIECGGDDERVVAALYDLGRTELQLGKLETAAATFQEAIGMAERLALPKSRLIAKLHQGLAASAISRRDFALAQAELAKAYDLALGVATDADLADLLVNQANLQQMQRNLPEAEALFERADVLLRTADNPLQQATVATSLGNLRMVQGRAAEAEVQFRRALELGEKQLGPNHPVLIRRLCNLAGVLGQTNRLDEAAPLLERAVALGNGVDARFDDGVANATVNLGNVRAMAGRHEDALALWQQALVIRERRDGKDSLEAVSILENIATGLDELGRHDEAEAVQSRIAAIRAKLK